MGQQLDRIDTRGHGGPLVLVIEDDPVIGMMLQDMVRLLGFEPVGPAGSIAAGLQLLDAHPRIAAAVLDCNLGHEYVWPLADRLAGSRVPFIFSTGYGEDGIPDRFAQRTVLAKPYSTALLKAALTRVMTK